MDQLTSIHSGLDVRGRCPVRLEFGRKRLGADQAQDLGANRVVELDSFVDDYVEVYADGRLIARGRPVVIDGKLAVRVQEALASSMPLQGKIGVC